MTSVLAPQPVFKGFDNNGAPLAFGFLSTYAAGTNTPQASYVDSTQTTQNTNPIQLNFRGECALWLDPTKTYKLLLTDVLGNTIPGWPVDNIPGGPLTVLSTDLLPTPTNTVNLGGPSNTFKNLYLGASGVGLLDTSGNVGFFAQTTAEIAASVTPTKFVYPEGDIRRYGATTGASDNSAAINNAFLVSNAGGSDVFLPPGGWKITSTLNPQAGGSLHGVGPASQILPQACDGFTFPIGNNGPRRVFRDFSLIGTSTSASNNGIATTVQPSAVWSCTFQNIFFQGFKTMVLAQGFRQCDWLGLSGLQNGNGFAFGGQNVNNHIYGCQIVRNGVTSGTDYAFSFVTLGGNTTQGTEITACMVNAYDINVNVGLAFELQVYDCDLSTAQITCVDITTTNGGVWITDCWIETNNASATTGIKIENITPAIVGHVVIRGNYINCTTPFAGSKGISVGNGNAGTEILGNKVIGFDQGITINACNGMVCRDNRINCVTSVYSATSYAITLGTNLCSDVTLGPNYIVGGTPVAATMSNASANIGVPASGPFPVGSPVQFDATANGFTVNVTYYVITSAANVITVGAVAGGSAITATGSTAVNVFQAPLPAILANGPPTGFAFYARGAFIGTLTGFGTSPAGVIDWVCGAGTVTLNARFTSNFTGTSNATTMTMTGLPSMLFPITTQQTLATVEDNGTFGYGTVTVTNAGAMTFHKDANASAFTNTGTKGVNTQPMTWLFT